MWALRLLLLVPASVGLFLAARLALAAWSANSASSTAPPDPIIEALLPRSSVSEGSDLLLDRASDLAWLDFRYASRAGWNAWEEAARRPGGGVLISRAREEFLVAARRAPTQARVREGLWLTAGALGDQRFADGQAKASVDLAPMDSGICARAGRYLWARYREDRSRTDLLHAAIRAMRHEPDRMAATLLEKAYDYAEIRRDFARAGVPLREIMEDLVVAGRWEWAIRAARELDREDPRRGGKEARVHLGYARYLLDRRLPEGALEHVKDARILLGERFRAFDLLGRSLLATGASEKGREALYRARAEGLSVSGLAGILRTAGTDPVFRAAFWGGLVGRGDASAGVRLEWARALVAAGEHARALPVLRRLLEEDESSAPAHHLLALCFLEVGNPRVASAHARRASDLDPGNRAYRALAERLSRQEKQK